MQQCGYTQEAVANRLSKSRPAVANLLRLLTLPDQVLEQVRTGALSAGHARVLAGLEKDAQKIDLAQKTLQNGWSVRQLEQVAAAMKQEADKPAKALPKPKTLPAELSEFETRVRETLGVRATLTGSAKKGKIVLQYYSQEELEHLNELLTQLSDM